MSTTPPLLSLREASICFGNKLLFSDLSTSISKGEKICLVGKNGYGKSSILKALAGLIEVDVGERFVQPGTRIGFLPQDVQFVGDTSVSKFVSEGGAPLHYVATLLDQYRLDGNRSMDSLSGGELRRAGLARTLSVSPDILLLDEPTNHLDLPTIEELEIMLRRFHGGWIAVSHDRKFLRNTTLSTLWLYNGQLHKNPFGFSEFENWSDNIVTSDKAEGNRIEQMFRAEVRYLHLGVTARRKRNQLRLKRLATLRSARSQRLKSEMQPTMGGFKGTFGGKLVLEAENLVKAYNGTNIVNGFSTRLMKGDRVGIIGRNGVGKSTLLEILTGRVKPEEGRVRSANNLRIAHFDQGRKSLDPSKTPVDILCKGGGDTIVVNGQHLHVTGYLSDFLFRESQVWSPIGSLSGGEQSRLLLAKILLEPSNLLVLDEPTNDLDMDTLDILQDRLQKYEGTLLMVSHDRDFLDHIVTSVITMEENGIVTEYAGGYSDHLSQRTYVSDLKGPHSKNQTKHRDTTPRNRIENRVKKLSWKEKQDLDILPGRVTALETKILELENRLSDQNLFNSDPSKFEKYASQLSATKQDLENAEDLWLHLELKRDLGLPTDEKKFEFD